jgi:hypothetical protein
MCAVAARTVCDCPRRSSVLLGQRIFQLAFARISQKPLQPQNLGGCIAALPILQCNKDFIDVQGFPLERLHPKLTWLSK